MKMVAIDKKVSMGQYQKATDLSLVRKGYNSTTQQLWLEYINIPALASRDTKEQTAMTRLVKPDRV